MVVGDERSGMPGLQGLSIYFRVWVAAGQVTVSEGSWPSSIIRQRPPHGMVGRQHQMTVTKFFTTCTRPGAGSLVVAHLMSATRPLL